LGGMTLPMIGNLRDDPVRAGLEQVGYMLRAKPTVVANACFGGRLLTGRFWSGN